MELATDAHREADGGETLPRASLAAAWTMVFIFLFFYTISFIDRTIISMMVGPIQADLALSDFQMSLLLGPAFGLFYVICGLPMGWVVDRFSRRWTTAIGVAVWGTATALCGLASNYGHLFLARMGVGVGESALTPSAHAMIAEQFPRKYLSTAMSVYTLGAVFGGGLAMVAGGTIVHFSSKSGTVALPLIGELRAWQFVFGALGLLTVLTAPLTFFVKERASRTESSQRDGASTGLMSLLRAHWILFIGAPLGFGFINSISQAYASWVPTFMIREFGWNIAEIGAAWGIQHVIAGGIGFVGSAMVVDKLYAAGYADAHTRYPLYGLCVSVPLAVWGFHCGNPWLFLALNAVFYLLSYGWIGYAAASLQIFAPSHLRGRISAILLAIATVTGTGLGAPLTGWLTDMFADKQRIGASLSLVTVIFAVLAAIFLTAARHKMELMHSSLRPVHK